MFKTKGGGGSKAFWTMFKKTADLAEVGSPYEVGKMLYCGMRVMQQTKPGDVLNSFCTTLQLIGKTFAPFCSWFEKFLYNFAVDFKKKIAPLCSWFEKTPRCSCWAITMISNHSVWCNYFDISGKATNLKGLVFFCLKYSLAVEHHSEVLTSNESYHKFHPPIRQINWIEVQIC